MKKNVGTVLVVLLGLGCGLAGAEPIRDRSDGQYCKWTVDQDPSYWTLAQGGGSVTIANGGLNLYDNDSSTGACVTATRLYGASPSANYVIQYDIKWRNFTGRHDYDFAIQSGNGSSYTKVKLIYLDDNYSGFGPADNLTNESGTYSGVVFHDIWYRVIQECHGDNYTITLQQLEDGGGQTAGHVWLDNVFGGSVSGGTPTEIKFSSEADGGSNRSDVVINNVKVGEPYSIKDVSDGRYFKWSVDQGTTNGWWLKDNITTPDNNTWSGIADGGLELIDNSTQSNGWVTADGYFPTALTSTRYVIQYDIKWKDFTPSAGLNYFAIQDRDNGTTMTNRMYLAIDKYPSGYGAPAGAMTDHSQGVVSQSPLPLVYVNTWYRVIVERSGDTYYTTLQKLQDGSISINRVSKQMWNPTVRPTKIEFTSGAISANPKCDVVINNVKVGEPYSPETPIKDVSDGRYFKWAAGDNDSDNWSWIKTSGGSVTVSDGGQELIDNSTADDGWVTVDGTYSNYPQCPDGLRSTSYVVQYDIKWKDNSTGRNYFCIQDRSSDYFINRMKVKTDYWDNYTDNGIGYGPAAALVDHSGAFYSTNPVLFMNIWYRVIVQRYDNTDNYTITLQQLEDGGGQSAGHVWVDNVSCAVWDNSHFPTKIQFTSGADGVNQKCDIVINNVKVGEPYTHSLTINPSNVIKDLSQSYVGFDAEDFNAGADFHWMLEDNSSQKAQWQQMCQASDQRLWRLATMNRYSYQGDNATKELIRWFYGTYNPVLFMDTWYRVIEARHGDNFTLTLQQLDDHGGRKANYLWLDNVTFPVDNNTSLSNPLTRVEFTGGAYRQPDKSHVFIRNVWIGQPLESPQWDEKTPRHLSDGQYFKWTTDDPRDWDNWTFNHTYGIWDHNTIMKNSDNPDDDNVMELIDNASDNWTNAKATFRNGPLSGGTLTSYVIEYDIKWTDNTTTSFQFFTVQDRDNVSGYATQINLKPNNWPDYIDNGNHCGPAAALFDKTGIVMYANNYHVDKFVWFEFTDLLQFCKDNGIKLIGMIDSWAYYDNVTGNAVDFRNADNTDILNAAAQEACSIISYIQSKGYLDLFVGWEIGNEEWNGWRPDKYANWVRAVTKEAKAIDPTIKLGVWGRICTEDNPSQQDILTKVPDEEPTDPLGENYGNLHQLWWSANMFDNLSDSADNITYGLTHNYGWVHPYNATYTGIQNQDALFQAYDNTRHFKMLATEWMENGDKTYKPRVFRYGALWRTKMVLTFMAYPNMTWPCAHSLFGWGGVMYWADNDTWFDQIQSEDNRSVVFPGIWYRVILQRSDNTSYITLKQLDTDPYGRHGGGDLLIDNISCAVDNPAIQPNQIQLTSGGIGAGYKTHILISHVKIGEPVGRESNGQYLDSDIKTFDNSTIWSYTTTSGTTKTFHNDGGTNNQLELNDNSTAGYVSALGMDNQTITSKTYVIQYDIKWLDENYNGQNYLTIQDFDNSTKSYPTRVNLCTDNDSDVTGTPGGFLAGASLVDYSMYVPNRQHQRQFDNGTFAPVCQWINSMIFDDNFTILTSYGADLGLDSSKLYATDNQTNKDLHWLIATNPGRTALAGIFVNTKTDNETVRLTSDEGQVLTGQAQVWTLTCTDNVDRVWNPGEGHNWQVTPDNNTSPAITVPAQSVVKVVVPFIPRW